MKRSVKDIPQLEAGSKPGDDLFKPKKKYPSFWKNLTNYITEFTENTSLHGVRYLGEKKRTVFEKICWTTIFAISLFLCIELILKTYQKWDNSPVIVSFAQSPTPVWQIPFPAVTICPEMKMRQRVFNYTDFYHRNLANNLTEEEAKQYSDASLVCDTHLFHHGGNLTNLETLDFLAKVAPQFEEVLMMCKWTNMNETCSNLYTTVLTEDGICFTFNMLDRDDIYTNEVYHNKDFLKHGHDRHGWTLEKGYLKDAGRNTFPRRALSSGSKAGLTLLLRAFEQDIDYICKGPVQGFKLLFHHPLEVPRMSTQYFRVPLNQEVIVNVKPDMITISEALRNYDPHRRQCYFSSERQLRYYKNYTQQNCEVECLTNFTLATCGCVAHHMPHTESTPICGSGNTICMAMAVHKLLAVQVDEGISSFHEGDDEIKEGKCNCLPACTSLTYNAETSQADFNWQALFRAYKSDLNEFPGIQMARVTIFFKEMQFITSERNELYGYTDFLANCGGLLGLFIGFSFLSVIETIYFVTLRLVCNVRRYGRHYWSGSPELVNNDAYDHKK
ncbi:PREDICTED: pickpocket protein 28-like [Nicrophorus vespilloides]|uniref:Pickpocket protein 28-like n=1 Tax=Nicrophorus vespilloides TaxID=110193 RepID=A0ABM1M794_NICVS|nr:PREDICTED: pickpocket protein 28-like [Nicrophorus vespilloides]